MRTAQLEFESLLGSTMELPYASSDLPHVFYCLGKMAMRCMNLRPV
jgi:hypothetical protein